MGEKISAASDMKPFSHFFNSCYLYNANTRCLRGIYQDTDQTGIEKRGSPASAWATTDTSTKTAVTLHGWGNTPEKPSTVVVGTTGQSHHHHHQITITSSTSDCTTGTSGGVVTESKWAATKRLGFRRTKTWTSDPRRILLFFATLSSMGTILLIFFTLSLGELNGNEENTSI